MFQVIKNHFNLQYKIIHSCLVKKTILNKYFVM